MKNKSIEKKLSPYALWGFILSLLSIFGIGLAGLIGLVLGIVALVDIKHTKQEGKGLAIAAIVIGFIWSIGIGILRGLVERGY